MNTTLYPAVALLAWVVVLAGVRRLPAMAKRPSQLVVWLLYVCFALIFTTGSAPVWRRLDGWTGLPESNTLITMCLVVCYSAATLVLLQLWYYRPHRAWRRVKATLAAAAVVLVAMVALFLRCDGAHHHQSSFTAWYGGSVEYEIYLLIYLATYTAAKIELIRLCVRFAPRTTRSHLRTGLILIGAGSAIGLLYSLTRLADIVAARAHADLSSLENLAEVGAGLGCLLVMIGLSVDWWGPRISLLVTRVRRTIAYVRLRPLWTCFYNSDSSITVDGRRRYGMRVERLLHVVRILGDPGYYATRRAIEVRDGIVFLRPYQDPDDAERIRTYYSNRGLTGDDLDAAVIATLTHAALDARADAPRREQPPSLSAGNTPADLDAELAWLLKVAAYFKRQPHTFDVTASLDPSPTEVPREPGPTLP